MINGGGHWRFAVTDCNHHGNTMLTCASTLMLRCEQCNRWCEIPKNWFAPPSQTIYIVTEL